jgi:hypothetical protein
VRLRAQVVAAEVWADKLLNKHLLMLPTHRCCLLLTNVLVKSCCAHTQRGL